jgi:hypothetical protein
MGWIMNEVIDLRAKKSAKRRQQADHVQDILREFHAGNISLNQARDMVVDYFAPRTAAGSLD